MTGSSEQVPMPEIWYVSKYFQEPTEGHLGSRGFHIVNEMSRLGARISVFAANARHHDWGGGDGNSAYLEKVEINPNFELVKFRVPKYESSQSKWRIIGWMQFELLWPSFALLRKKRPNVIVASSLSILTIVPAILLKWILGCKVVFEVRDIWPLTLIEEGQRSPSEVAVKILGAIEWFGYRYSDAIVGTMPNLEPHVKEIMGQRRTKPVWCVPMGCIPTNHAQPTENAAQQLVMNLRKKEKFVIGYAGSINKTNAIHVLIEAAEYLRNNGEIEVVIVGSGLEKEKLKERAKGLTSVHILDPIPNSEVEAFLVSCSAVYVGTLSSRVWKYGQSLNKIIDYMQSGRPIIASYSGFRSMINEANCGFFVPAEKPMALAECIKSASRMSEERLSRMGASGKKWLHANRNYETIAATFLNRLKEL